jgi:hypothetical protein
LLLKITCEDLACVACRVSGHRPCRQAFGPFAYAVGRCRHRVCMALWPGARR